MLMRSARSLSPLPASVPAGAEDEERLADLDLVAGLQGGVRDGLVVDEGAVGAADVDEVVAAVDEAELGVPARHLGVVRRMLLPESRPTLCTGCGQLELLALVGALDDDQARHDTPFLQRLGLRPPYPRARPRVKPLAASQGAKPQAAKRPAPVRQGRR